MRRVLAFAIAMLLLTASASAEITTEISPLPWNDAPGYAPDPDNFTETGYYDDSIRVDITTTRRSNAEFYVADIKIKHPSQLRTGLSTSLGTKYNKPSAMAAHYNAVVAVNGDYYRDRKQGLVIRQGETLREKSSSLYDLLLIDTNGDFHIVKRDNLDMLEFYLAGALTIQNVFSFGPALVMDGEMQEIPEKYSFAPHYKNPRAAIGQLGELHYVIVICDGRQDDSAGCTLETLAQFMAELGCTQAYNLDGGNSATLVLGSTVFNHKAEERSISDILYFATTVQ